MNDETPTISSSSYTSSGIGYHSSESLVADVVGGRVGIIPPGFGPAGIQFINAGHDSGMNLTGANTFMDSMRLVRIILIDPDERLPIDQRVLVSVDEKWTDLTDVELRDELQISVALRKHNDMRERSYQLKPIRIRDLVMQVISGATVALKTSD